MKERDTRQNLHSSKQILRKRQCTDFQADVRSEQSVTEIADDDAEGETDEEYEGSPEELAAMLHKLREAGALRDPGKDGTLDGLEVEAEDQVDWGESGDEDGGS